MRPHPPALASAARTHGIAQRQEITLLRDSSALGWQGLYASFVQEAPWSAELPTTAAPGIAFCVSQASRVSRQLGRHRAEGCLQPRQFSVLPAQHPSRWTIAGHPRVLHLYVHAEIFANVADQFGHGHDIDTLLAPRLCAHDPVIAHVADAVLGLLQEGAPGDTYVADHLAHVLAARLLSAHALHAKHGPRAPANLPRERWQRLRDYIDAHLDDDLSLQTLADLISVHPTQVWRVFKTNLGISPHRYVLQRRLERARHLLARQSASIADIAAQTGFSSQSHLGTHFRREYGETPAGYRRANCCVAPAAPPAKAVAGPGTDWQQ